MGRSPAPDSADRCGAGAGAARRLGDDRPHLASGRHPRKGPAGEYLRGNGIKKVDFNSFGARRGNDRVMVRGTFANIRLKNLLVPGVEGGVTTYIPTGERMSIYDASVRYQREKGAAHHHRGRVRHRQLATGRPKALLLGVRAVIAESFERIHRANLVGMGVCPFLF